MYFIKMINIYYLLNKKQVTINAKYTFCIYYVKIQNNHLFITFSKIILQLKMQNYHLFYFKHN